MAIELIGTIPTFALDPPLFDELDTIFDRQWSIFHLLPCKVLCRFFTHSIFFGLSCLQGVAQSELGLSTAS